MVFYTPSYWWCGVSSWTSPLVGSALLINLWPTDSGWVFSFFWWAIQGNFHFCYGVFNLYFLLILSCFLFYVPIFHLPLQVAYLFHHSMTGYFIKKKKGLLSLMFEFHRHGRNISFTLERASYLMLCNGRSFSVGGRGFVAWPEALVCQSLS